MRSGQAGGARHGRHIDLVGIARVRQVAGTHQSTGGPMARSCNQYRPMACADGAREPKLPGLRAGLRHRDDLTLLLIVVRIGSCVSTTAASRVTEQRAGVRSLPLDELPAFVVRSGRASWGDSGVNPQRRLPGCAPVARPRGGRHPRRVDGRKDRTTTVPATPDVK